MIFLDTNYLIRGLINGTEESAQLTEWCKNETVLTTNSLVWCEFITGPITDEEINLAWHLVGMSVHAFDHGDSVLAAKLFNELARPRSQRIDIMITASAINRKATLATVNTADFTALISHGLSLFTAES